MRILYKVTSRSRPEAFHRTVKSIFDNATRANFIVWATVDEDDPTLSLYTENRDWGNRLVYSIAKSKNKIDAINRGVPLSGEYGHWHIIVNVSDDQVFTLNGFDRIICKEFTDGEGVDAKQNLDRFLHFPDQTPAAQTLPSMSIMGRAYYERFGYIYHPDFVSLWADNEAMEVAQMIGKYKYVDRVIYHHLHPWWVPGLPVDEQLKHTQTFYDQDQKTFNRRKRHGFPIHSVYS